MPYANETQDLGCWQVCRLLVIPPISALVMFHLSNMLKLFSRLFQISNKMLSVGSAISASRIISC
ncbi:hypothetical protein BDV32DRAFT_122385 [Aspergillus pseudonomiae]|nr:hypothetical protein BDV32DRAFT_122385 [Aspergillus pseudonomiae]